MNVIADRIVRKNPFLRDWSNYGVVDIFNPVATAQYQHSVTIPTKPGMMHDFRDLRFFQADGIEIPFWVESKTDGSTAFVWFKPYSVSNRQAYVFYGNREAVSQSNGDKVFEFFDDFNDNAISASWTSVAATVTEESQKIKMVNGSDSDACLSSSYSTAGDFCLVCGLSAEGTSSGRGIGIDCRNSATNWFTVRMQPYDDNFRLGKYVNSSWSWVATLASTIATSTQYRVIFAKTGTSLGVTINGSYLGAFSDAFLDDYTWNIGLRAFGNQNSYCDYFAIKKYTGVEPSCTLISTERNPFLIC